jgi:predicted nuclease of predicted toxin-antitoxin system
MTQLKDLEFWIDLNLPPQMATWLTENFGVNAKSFKDLNFTEVADVDVYKIAAIKPNIIIITTKDIDFSNYQNIVGAPPRILFLNIGNISNKNLKLLIEKKFEQILQLFLITNDPLIEISTE